MQQQKHPTCRRSPPPRWQRECHSPLLLQCPSCTRTQQKNATDAEHQTQANAQAERVDTAKATEATATARAPMPPQNAAAAAVGQQRTATLIAATALQGT